MSGSTHSGAVFSPYDLVASSYDPGGEPHIIKTGISLAPYIQASLAAADLRADRCEATVTSSWEIVGGDIAAADVQEADEWEDLVEVSSRPASPLSELTSLPSTLLCSGSPPSFALSSPSSWSSSTSDSLEPTNNAAPATFDNTAMPVLLPVGGIEIRRNKESTAARRARRRRSTATHSPFDKRPNLRYQHRALPPVLIDALASALPHTKAAWVGIKGKKRGGRRVLTVKELKGRGYRLIKWDGGHPIVIVDQDGRIVCVFVGKPDDPEWDTKIPGNLVNSKPRRRILCTLFRNRYIRCIAGFQSSAFAYWAPKVYREYADVLRQLSEKYPGFEHNFRNSIFPAAAFNCSLDTVAAEHTDYGNNPAGWCAITSGGRFNHKRGAHLHMRQFKLLVEFPSGTSALVLSGAVNYGNTPIAADETRFSMTQYAAGGLFRWVRYGFMTAKALLAQKGGKELRDAYDGVPGSR
ncbi:hypothetical protein B0H17DRAFT_1220103 [Mycena rosella]|uniref:Uncharacterized protein n=1 Tax=Mycena rosella TaxID=1033263 RepID=A0AAD7BCY0_MYCRO|nr:hypothetical protein B0H17DRAFT_1220103 [Mycena rosella]